MIFKTLKRLFKQNIPRYTYAYDNSEYDEKSQSLMCILKVFADHTFIKINAEEILNNMKFKNYINPDDLLIIQEKYKQTCLEKEIFFIKESLINGKYKIGNTLHEDIYDANEVLENKYLLEKLNPEEIFNIAYFKGLADGRQINKQIQAYSEQEKAKTNAENIIQFMDNQNKRFSN